MQISQPGPGEGPAEAGRHVLGEGPAQAGRHVQPGAIVRVRRCRWRIVDVRAYEACQLVTLSSLTPPQEGIERRVLTPFDVIEPISRRQRPRIVRASTWRAASRALIAADAPPGSLRSARRARIDLFAHQIEPALAVLRGLGSRVLLADEVGLGKTIQAGLIASELRARGACDRMLVLTPAGLREQWAQELADRFTIDARVVDAHSLGRLAATLPIDVNPWSTLPVAIASIEYVKRPEVLPAVGACRWDLVIVDEAHGAASESDRHAAVSAICSRATYVLLLTATPHNGDRRSFESLCGLGSLGGDRLLAFRRSRRDVGIGVTRRVRTLSVRPSADELRMHALLARYSDAIRAERGDGWLALAVLHKRALSSAWALAASIDRRLATLSKPAESVAAEQLALPLDPNGDFSAADESPVWPAGLSLADPARERRLLRSLAGVARAAATRETKVAALQRLLRRMRESAIVFTEYRDTLQHIQRQVDRPVIVLHGGLSRDERAAALAAFSQAGGAVLLATDAAGEGLNLHHTCRIVINLELPWNPMRLEQRIGRVDRIGQRRAVHAVHLVARGTGETRILTRLKTRIAAAQSAVGAPDPLGAEEERAVARLVIAGDASPSFAEPAYGEIVRDTPNFRRQATGEVDRLIAARSYARDDDEEAGIRIEGDGPWIATARRSELRRRLRARVLVLWRMSAEDACGRTVESRLVPMAIDCPLFTRTRRSRREIEALLSVVDGDVRARIDTCTRDWRVHAQAVAEAFRTLRLARERAIAAEGQPRRPDRVQIGLFDRREERAYLLNAAAHATSQREAADRIAAIDGFSGIAAWPARLLLVVTP